MADLQKYNHFYLSYSGIKLPLKLVGPLELSEIENRNTFFASIEDDQGRVTEIAKVVYNEIELHHHYRYHDDDQSLVEAVITADGETHTIQY
ncbi:hypothetical protein SAMN03080615_03561 [Amphritea atlantica]|uniref:YD repeat-containing protein n=1 Tax=Amphritea atlantica TaxID=355243 RepID=A0A1H9KP53_9GAMM|nr:DUF6156 family protein [Amphritea atlantica]SER00705.1 hypothetical protein SAMN03080615_03561 [Amphritea atlantica]